MLVIGIVLLFAALGLYALSMTYAYRRHQKVLLVAAVVVNAAAAVSLGSAALVALLLLFIAAPYRILAIAVLETWGGSDSYKYEEYPGTLRAAIELVRIQNTVRA